MEWATSLQQKQEPFMGRVLRLLRHRKKPRRSIDAQPDLAAREPEPSSSAIRDRNLFLSERRSSTLALSRIRLRRAEIFLPARLM
jgi:hypothetical protein